MTTAPQYQPTDTTKFLRPSSLLKVRQSLRSHLLNYSTSQLLKVSFRVNGRLPLYHQYIKFQSQRNPAITDPSLLRQFSPVVLRNTSYVPTYTQHFISHIQAWVSTTSLPSGHPARQLPPSLLCCTPCACCCHPISLSVSSRSTSLIPRLHDEAGSTSWLDERSSSARRALVKPARRASFIV